MNLIRKEEIENIDKQLHTMVDIYEQDLKPTIKELETIEINSQDDAENLKNISQVLAERGKEAENIRNDLLNPYREQTKKINDFCKRVTGPIEQARRKINGLLLAWQKSLQPKPKLADISDLLSKSKLEIKEEMKPEQAPIIQERKTWTFDIVDSSKIPRQYMTPDTVEINKAIRTGKRSIKGLKIYQKSTGVL